MIKSFSEFLNENKKEKGLSSCEIDIDTSALEVRDAKEVFKDNGVRVVSSKSGPVSDSHIFRLKGERKDIEAALIEIDFDPDQADWQD
jgi:hypothetical protein